MKKSAGSKHHKAEGLRGKKRQKLDKIIATLENPLSKELFSDDSISRLRKEHNSNKPYKYVVLNDLCNADRMRLIHEDAKNNMTATFKETDLFKVRETPQVIHHRDLHLMTNFISFTMLLRHTQFCSQGLPNRRARLYRQHEHPNAATPISSGGSLFS
jgi:hypothetical protein